MRLLFFASLLLALLLAACAPVPLDLAYARAQALDYEIDHDVPDPLVLGCEAEDLGDGFVRCFVASELAPGESHRIECPAVPPEEGCREIEAGGEVGPAPRP